MVMATPPGGFSREGKEETAVAASAIIAALFNAVGLYAGVGSILQPTERAGEHGEPTFSVLLDVIKSVYSSGTTTCQSLSSSVTSASAFPDTQSDTQQPSACIRSNHAIYIHVSLRLGSSAAAGAVPAGAEHSATTISTAILLTESRTAGQH
jgi:hypothetical protein